MRIERFRFFKLKKVHIILLCFTFVITFITAISYAWILLGNYSDYSSFSTASGNALSLSIGQFDGNEYVWTDCKQSETDEFSTSSSLENLNFGVIDNITTLKKSNVIFLRLTVPANAGNQVGLSLNSPSDTSPFGIYYYPDGNGSEKVKINNDTVIKGVSGEQIISNLSRVYEESDGYIEYFYAASDNSNPDFDSLTFSEACYIDGNIKQADIEFSGNQKYIFIKLMPKLDSYIKILDTINTFMPCYMDFSVNAEFEVMENGGNS